MARLYDSNSENTWKCVFSQFESKPTVYLWGFLDYCMCAFSSGTLVLSYSFIHTYQIKKKSIASIPVGVKICEADVEKKWTKK